MSRRTIFRDLDALRRVEVPLVFDEDQHTYCIPGQYFLPPTNFTAEEALAVLVLCHEFGADGHLPFWRAARDAATKLEHVLPAELVRDLRQITPAIHIKVDATNSLDGQRSIYEQLVAAITKRQPVGITYDSLHERERLQTRLHPYKLLFNQHTWYVIGRSGVHKEVRTFNVGRIAHLELLPDSFDIPKSFSLDRYLRNAWRLIPEEGPDVEVHLRFRPQVARNVREVAWHRTQRAVELADGSLDYRVTVSGLNEISWWILGYGDQVEVLSPEPLRQRIRERAKKMVEMYQ